jgi:hypothetical protein
LLGQGPFNILCNQGDFQVSKLCQFWILLNHFLNCSKRNWL